MPHEHYKFSVSSTFNWLAVLEEYGSLAWMLIQLCNTSAIVIWLTFVSFKSRPCATEKRARLTIRLQILLLYIFVTSVHTYGYVFYTYPQPIYIYTGTYLYGSKLIQIRTEPLQNKHVFIQYFTGKVLFYITLISNINYKSTFFSVINLIDSNKCNLNLWF